MYRNFIQLTADSNKTYRKMKASVLPPKRKKNILGLIQDICVWLERWNLKRLCWSSSLKWEGDQTTDVALASYWSLTVNSYIQTICACHLCRYEQTWICEKSWEISGFSNRTINFSAMFLLDAWHIVNSVQNNLPALWCDILVTSAPELDGMGSFLLSYSLSSFIG